MFLPAITERISRSHLLRKSQCKRVFNPCLRMMYSINEMGVTGFIFHFKVERTKSSILWIVFASKRYLASSTCKNHTISSSFRPCRQKTEQIKAYITLISFDSPANPREGGLGSLPLWQPERDKLLQRAEPSMAYLSGNGRWRGSGRDS